MIQSWILFPSEPQRPICDPVAALRRLRGKCQVIGLDDGSLLLTGNANVLTREFRLQTLAYVTELWLEMQKGRR